jgi:hypothetical protein
MQNFNIEKIHKTIWIFKKALKNSQEIIDYFEKNKNWADWYTFGKVTVGNGMNYNFKSFPTKEEWEKQVELSLSSTQDETDAKIKKQINNLFYDITSLYLKENNIELDNWIFENWNLAKYKLSNGSKYAMQHHTDFQRELEYAPGNKFGVTVVFYLNDNYEGGEVEYRLIEGNDLNNIAGDYTYKPSTGDVSVFLSGHPHYHGVRSVAKGEKYIIRTYWRYNKEAHPKWTELKEKYGDAWEQMEKDRKIYDQKHSGKINNIPVVTNFEEYYKMIENNN